MNEASSKIAAHLEASFRQATGSLTGKDYTITALPRPGSEPVFEEPFIWQQSFAGVEGPSLWIRAGKDVWAALARVTLEAAGLDQITDTDARSTWQEILGQTIAGVAAGITADLLRELTVAKGEELAVEPRGLRWKYFSVSEGAGAEADPELETPGAQPMLGAAWSSSLLAAYEPRPPEVRERTTTQGTSKTFDVLLDVSLPVSVSFGRTSLQIREVLKLSTGSIVELNRFVTDPVEVIVNDCVIARGEVVVVDGNYGVRINKLATRRTG